MKSVCRFVFISLLSLQWSFSVAQLLTNIPAQLSNAQGKLSYSIALDLPASIHDIRPNLALHYSNSHADRYYGLGMTLSGFSHIERCPQTLAIDGFNQGAQLHNSDVFCLDGKRLIHTAGIHGAQGASYRLQDDLNTLITLQQSDSSGSPQSWLLQKSNGQIASYGGINATEYAENLAYRWHISRNHDQHHNGIDYTYQLQHNSLYPTQIAYPGYEVRFHYENRSDTKSYYLFGVQKSIKQRLSRIQLYAANSLIKTYKLNYFAQDSTSVWSRFSRLQSLQICDKHAICSNPHELVWQRQSNKATPSTTEIEAFNEQIRQQYIALLEAEREEKIRQRQWLIEEQTANLSEQELQHYTPPAKIPPVVTDFKIPDAIDFDQDGYADLNHGFLAIRQKDYHFPTFVDINRDGLRDVCFFNAGLYCAINAGQGNFQQAQSWGANLAPHASDTIDYTQLLLHDLNADGKPEYCLSNRHGFFCAAQVQDYRFSALSQWSQNFKDDDNHYITLDINHDKRLDLCTIKNGQLLCAKQWVDGSGFHQPQMVHDTAGAFIEKQTFNYAWNESITVYEGAGDGETQSQKTVSRSTTSAVKLPSIQVLDINSDQVADICGISARLSFSCHLGKAYSDGISFSNPEDWSPQLPLGNSQKTYSRGQDSAERQSQSFVRSLRIRDLNSDGYLDICYRHGGQYQCQFNTGKAFAPVTDWLALSIDDYQEANIQLFDINNDAQLDFCTMHGAHLQCAENQSSYFDQLRAYVPIFADIESQSRSKTIYTNAIKKRFGLDTKITSQFATLKHTPLLQAPDLNQDGFADICYRGIQGFSCAGRTFTPLAQLIGGIDSFGNITKVSYAWLSDAAVYSQDHSASPFIDFTGEGMVVHRIQQSNGIGTLSSKRFHYQGHKWHPNSGTALRQISEFSSDTQLVNRNEYITSGRYTGQLKATHKTTLADQPVTITHYEYTHTSATDSAHIAQTHIAQTQVHQYHSDGNWLSSKRTQNLSFNHKGEITHALMQHSAVDLATISAETHSQYLVHPIFTGLATQISVTHRKTGTADIVRTSQFSYNQKGQLLRQILQPQSDLALSKTFQYDSKGNLTKTTSADQQGEQRSISKTYDTLGRPLSITNALGHQEQWTYHSECGLVQTHTDPNALVTRFSYDSQCRKTKQTHADGTYNQWFYSYSAGADAGLDYLNTGLTLGDRSYYQVTQQDSNGNWQQTFYDRHNRPVRLVKRGFNNSEIIIDKAYDALGRLAGETLPYKKGHFAGDATTWKVNRYDALGRIKQQQAISLDKTISTDYHYAPHQISEQLGQFHKTIKQDQQGNIIAINEAGKATLSHQYDAIGQRIHTNAGGNISSISYNARGFKTQISDSAMGQWQYSYNAFGELIQQTDAKGQRTQLSYDRLGRILTRQRIDSSGRRIDTDQFRYDGNNAIGKLSESENAQAKRHMHYDSLGRISSKTTVIDQQTFRTHYQYNANGQLQTLTQPSSLPLHYHYAINGQLKSIHVHKKDTWDLDLIDLENKFKAVVERIAQLQAKVVELEAQLETYKTEAARYASYANNLNKSSDSLASQANSLFNTAAFYQNQANNYQDKVNNYRKSAYFYQNWLGSMTLKFLKLDGHGNAIYQSSRCTHRNWKGSCTRHQYYTATVPEFMVKQHLCVWRSRGKGRSSYQHCYWGSAKEINVAETYHQWADYYQILASQYQQHAASANHAANYYANLANQFKNQANQQRQLAIQATAQAATTAKQLSSIGDELTQQLQSKTALQQDIQARANNADEIVLWRAIDYHASGKLQAEQFNNGMLDRRVFDAFGRVQNITSGVGKQLSRDLSYSYDVQDRLVQWHYQGPQQSMQHHYQYDDRANLSYKSDAGNLIFNAANQLTQRIDPQSQTHYYHYDANGNQIQGDGRNISYTSFNKPEVIEQGPQRLEFRYDAQQRRIKKRIVSSHAQISHYYIDKTYEHTFKQQDFQQLTIMRHYLYVNGQAVGVYERKSQRDLTPQQTGWFANQDTKLADIAQFFYRDALGNTDIISDNSDQVLLRQIFSPYGTPISLAESDDFNAQETRGFTGHEQLQRVQLVHMNARLYDPFTARFLSADSQLGGPESSSFAYNRYAYAANNPLKYTDPSGHWVWFAIGATLFITGATMDDTTHGKFLMVVGSVMMVYAVGPSAGTGASAVSSNYAMNYALVSAAQTYALSGDAGAAVQAGVIGGISGGLSQGINATELNAMERLLADATAGGLTSIMSGGDFDEGFKTALYFSAARQMYRFSSMQVNKATKKPYNRTGEPHVWQKGESNVGKNLPPGSGKWYAEDSPVMKRIGEWTFFDAMSESHDGGVDWAKKTPIAYLPSLVYNQGSILPFYVLTVAAYVQPYANLYIITKNNQARDY